MIRDQSVATLALCESSRSYRFAARNGAPAATVCVVMLRIAVTVAALFSLAACGPSDFDSFDTGINGDDPEFVPVDVWADEPIEDADADEGGEGGGEGGEPMLPDMGGGEPEIVDACCVCGPFGAFDESNPWCGPVDGPEGCAEMQQDVELPTEWHTDCEQTDFGIVCPAACA